MVFTSTFPLMLKKPLRGDIWEIITGPCPSVCRLTEMSWFWGERGEQTARLSLDPDPIPTSPQKGRGGPGGPHPSLHPRHE